MSFKSGDTFLLPLGIPKQREHLWFVLTDPDSSNQFLAVNLTHYEVFKDQTVVLSAGHPFITKRSLIEYPAAQLMSVDAINQALACGMAVMKEPCPLPLLKTIREGFLKSEEPPQEMQDYLKTRWAGA